MNRADISILIFAVALLMTACGGSESPNAQNVNTGRASANTALNRATNSPAVPANASNGSASANTYRAKQLDRVAADAPAEELVDNVVEYSENCMICHKDTGKGGKVTIEGKTIDPVDLTSAKMKARSDDKLLAQIKEGAPDDGMPAFKEKLSDEAIKGIIKHIRALQAR